MSIQKRLMYRRENYLVTKDLDFGAAILYWHKEGEMRAKKKSAKDPKRVRPSTRKKSEKKESLVDFFRNSPLAEGPIDLRRERDYDRKIDLS